MQFKKRFGVFIGAFLAVVLAVASCSLLFRTTTQPADAEPRMTVAEKKAELEAAEGQCDEYSIVLQDTNEETVLALAEKLGATYRITEDKTFATLTLPADITIFDVYDDADYEVFLTEFTPDYYAHIAAEDALGNALIATRPNYEVFDEYYAQQTYLDYLNLSDTWATTKGQGVTVAIIDTGIDTDHPEFAGRISDYSYNASEGKVVRDYGIDVIEDEQGHGTKVAGVLAAGMDDSGVTGIAPEAEILVIKCECDEYGQFVRSSDLVFGLAYAIERDVDVVNMSFGTAINLFSKYTQLAVDSDIVCVAAAGNDGSSLPSYPAADPNVIGVGAVDQDTWSLASYSNYGDNSEVLAPGTTFTTDLDGSYMYGSGTSLSSPIVAGAVALYLSQNPYSEYATVEGMLQASSIDIGPLGEDWENGFGLLDVYSLVCAEKGTLTYEMLTDEVPNQTQPFVRGRTIQRVLEPERENVVLDGWYYDTEATDEYAYFEDAFTQDLTLYASWINEDEGSAYIYTTLPNGTVELQSYLGRRRYLTVPSELEGKPVTSIGEFAFANNSRIRSITLPETLTNIGQYAFQNVAYLRSIDIPEAVTNIANNAFEGCASLTQVNIRQNSQLASIGEKAFSMCGIQSFTIPSRLTYLGDDAFFASTALRTLTIQDGNTVFTLRDNALYNAAGTTLIYYPAGRTGTYSVPAGTTTVGLHAFACSKSTEIILNDGVKTLREGVFYNASIRHLTIPSSVQEIGAYCCEACYDLGDVTLTTGGYSTIPNGGFAYCHSLRSVLIPAQIQTIDDFAFIGSGLQLIDFSDDSQLTCFGMYSFACTSLKSITIPVSVQVISDCSFNCCSMLSSVEFEPDSQCAIIQRSAFENCSSLQSINLPDSLVALGELAFYQSGLEVVSVGSGLTELGMGCFSGCRSLIAINVSSANPKYSSYDGVVYDKAQEELLFVPGAREGVYSLPNTVKRIAGYAFAGAKKLTNVELNDGLEEIGEYAFYGCNGLTVQDFPDSLQIIGDHAFSECINLFSMTLPNSLETIGAYSFSYCSSLSEPIVIPKRVISIGYYAFYGDYSLKSITIAPESELSRLDYGVFACCGITDFTVPESISTMAQEIFTGCRNLITVTFEGDNQLTNLAAWTFKGADNLRQITFEEGSHLTIIEARACEGLPKLERISLENCTELDTIDNYAFSGCVALSAVALPDSLVSIGRYAFTRCESLTELRIPATVEHIGRYAFVGTSGLNVYFRSATLPTYLEENWDYGLAGYYMGVSGIHTSGDWTYALTEDGKASIIAYTGSDADITLTTIDGYEIVSIGSAAFEGNTTLRSITLPSTLTGIYNAAFKGTTALKSVTVPASVTIIDNEAFRGSGLSAITFGQGSALQTLGRYAFAETPNLATISIPSGVEKIRDYAFYKSGLQTIGFASGSSLSEIGRYAFAQSALASIALPDTLTKIDYYAFSEASQLASIDLGTPQDLMIFGNAFYNSGLRTVTIPAGVTYLGELCFTSCQQLTDINVVAANDTYSSIDGVLFNKAATKLITCPAGKTGSYEIAPTVATMAFAAFESSQLSEVVIPDDSQLITIGYRAFFDCDNLMAIDVPASVLSIDNYAFAYCDNLSTVSIDADSQMNGIYKSAFYDDDTLQSISIPDSVQEIGDYAFYGCSGLSSLRLSDTGNLKMVADHAFEYASVTEFCMPDGIQEIGDYAFHRSGVKRLEFNSNLVSIGEYAFFDCTLADTYSLNIPESVSYMGFGAFKGETGVVEMTLPFLGEYFGDAKNGQLSKFVGDNPINLRKVTVLGGTFICEEAFKFENNPIEEIVVPASVVEIGPRSFYGAENMHSFEIPQDVVEIKENTFAHSGLMSIVIPERVVRIGWDAFAYCWQLENIALNDELREIDSEAFFGCGYSEVFIPAGIRLIGSGAFFGDSFEAIRVDENNEYYTSIDNVLYDKSCTKIVAVPTKLSGDIQIPEGVTEIGGKAFYNTNITNVTFPSTLRKIGYAAFEYCFDLTEVVIPESVTEVEGSIFSSCSSLVYAEARCKVNDLIGMFHECRKLETLILPDTLEVLDVSFLPCLKELIIPDSVYGIVQLRDCDQLEYVYIGANLEEIYNSEVFANCPSLKSIEVSPKNTNYVMQDGILYTSDYSKIITMLSTISGKVVVPEGVEEISSGLFSGRPNIEEIVLPNSVRRIGSQAFAGCTSLSKITFGEGIEYISWDILDSTPYADNSSNYKNHILYVGDYAVDTDINYYLDASTDLRAVKYFSIPEGTTLLAAGIFRNCNFISVYIPDSVRFINDYAFENSRNLRILRMSQQIESIGLAAFARTALRSISLPESLRYISEAFEETPLTYINIVGQRKYEVMGGVFWGTTEPIQCIRISWPNYDWGTGLWVDYFFDTPFTGSLVLEDSDDLELIINSHSSNVPTLSNNQIYVPADKDSMTGDYLAGIGDNVHFGNEWNLATFFINDMIVKMEPMLINSILHAPASTLIGEYLLAGQTFVGWDIDGDGKADTLPATLTDDLEAVAILTTPISGIGMQEEATVELGDTLQLDATCEPVYNNGNEALVWSTSDASVATVDGNGLVTPVAEGVATITATLVDNPEISASCEVTVIPRQPGIHLEETSGTLVKGETMTLAPEVIQPEGVDEPIEWASTDEDVATVENGLITALAGGKTDIVITCGEFEAVFKLTVTSPMVGMSIANPISELNVGETHALELAFEPEDTTDSKSATYASSDTSVATVSRAGVVTALKPGTTTITVTVGEFSDSFELEVFAPIKWIKLNTTTGTMRIERTKQLEVIYEPSNTTDDRTATFVSSDPEVATVTEDGLVTAVSAGQATITCTVGEHEATYTVTVVGLKNAETGIIVTNSDDSQMGEATELEIVNVSAETPEAADALTNDLENEIGEVTTTTVLDISLTEGGETVQPDTAVDVEIPVAGDLTHDTVLVYRAEEDGSFTDMTAEKGDDYLTFTTEHFSVYMVSVVHEFTNYVYNNDAHGATDGTETAVCDHPGCTVTHTRTAVGTGCKLAEVAEVPATCTEAGTATHFRCEDCGKLYVLEGGSYVEKTMNELVIPATGHDWDEGVVTTAATCEADGVRTFTCTICGETRTEAISATGHSFVSVAEASATCTEAGMAAHFKCSTCGKLFTLVNGAYVETAASDLVIPALGHDWDDGVVTTQPTCETDGTITYTCKHDTSHTRTDTIPATGHSWDQGTVTKPATTTEEGVITFTCTVCGETRTESIPKLEPEHEPGWANEDGSWFYYEEDGTPRTEQWIQIGKSWGYLGVDGRLIEAGWAPAGNTWYYIKNYTVMKEGWASYGGNWYYIKNYSVMKQGWVVTSGKYFYIRSYTPVTNDWVRYNGTWYHFNASGVCDRVA